LRGSSNLPVYCPRAWCRQSVPSLGWQALRPPPFFYFPRSIAETRPLTPNLPFFTLRRLLQVATFVAYCDPRQPQLGPGYTMVRARPVNVKVAVRQHRPSGRAFDNPCSKGTALLRCLLWFVLPPIWPEHGPTPRFLAGYLVAARVRLRAGLCICLRPGRSLIWANWPWRDSADAAGRASFLIFNWHRFPGGVALAHGRAAPPSLGHISRPARHCLTAHTFPNHRPPRDLPVQLRCHHHRLGPAAYVSADPLCPTGLNPPSPILLGGTCPERRLYPSQSAAGMPPICSTPKHNFADMGLKGQKPVGSTGRRCRPTSRTRSTTDTKGIESQVRTRSTVSECHHP